MPLWHVMHSSTFGDVAKLKSSWIESRTTFSILIDGVRKSAIGRLRHWFFSVRATESSSAIVVFAMPSRIFARSASSAFSGARIGVELGLDLPLLHELALAVAVPRVLLAARAR